MIVPSAEMDAIRDADQRVLAALTAVREDLERERADRRRGLIMQAITLSVAGLLVTTIAVLIVYQASCRTITEANRTTLTVLNAILDGGARRDTILSPEQQKEAAIRREEARKVGRDLLQPDACK